MPKQQRETKESEDPVVSELKGELEEAKKTILLMQEELEAVTKPPYIAGTVLEIGDETVRVSVDNLGTYEVSSDKKIKKDVKKGSRVVLSSMTKAVVGYSEFDMLGGEIASVEEVVGDRLKISRKGEMSFVLTAVEDVKAGEDILLDPSGVIAIEKLEKKKTRYDLEEIPEAPWNKIGGLENTIVKIKEEIEDPFVHKDIYAKYGKKPAKGILLYGPPGCGKTMIAKSIAYNLAQIGDSKEKKGRFIRINGPEILDKWLGNSEANIRRIYESAREIASKFDYPVVVFIDEAESVLKVRGSGISTDIYDSIVPQFLSEMDGINSKDNVITVLATNREDILDPALLRDGRVDKKIKVPRPNQQGATEIFRIYLKDKPVQKGSFGKKDYNEVAEELANRIYDDNNVAYNVVSSKHGSIGTFTYKNLISGAMIKGIVDKASSYAIGREISGGTSGLSEKDLEKAVQEEFRENTDFAQTLVKDDWEDVFGAQGKQYHDAFRQGYLMLEKETLKPTHEKE